MHLLHQISCIIALIMTLESSIYRPLQNWTKVNVLLFWNNVNPNKINFINKSQLSDNDLMASLEKVVKLDEGNAPLLMSITALKSCV